MRLNQVRNLQSQLAMSSAIVTTTRPQIRDDDNNLVLLQQQPIEHQQVTSLPDEVPPGIDPEACLATLALAEQKLVSLRSHVISGCLHSRQPASYRELKRWTKGQAHWLSLHHHALVGLQEAMARVQKLRQALLEIPVQAGPKRAGSSVTYSP